MITTSSVSRDNPSLMISTFEDSRGDLAPQKLDPSWIREGVAIRGKTFTKSLDGTFNSGIWECDVGKFEWHYYDDEVAHILEGEAHVNDGKKVHILLPGTVVFFPRGLIADWEIVKYVKKVFIVRTVKVSPLRKIASMVKRRLVGNTKTVQLG